MSKHPAPNLKICLLSVPVPEMEGGHILVLNFLKVLVPIADEIYLITGNYPKHDLPGSRVHLTNVSDAPLTRKPRQALPIRAARYLAAQVKMSCRLARVAPGVDVVIFFIGGSGLLLPMLTARLRQRRTIVVTAASGPAVSRNMYRKSLGGAGGLLTHGSLSLLERLNYALCHGIVVYSPGLVSQFHLQRYRRKISVAHRHFLDFDEFRVAKPLSDRDNVVGCIGRLSREKGTLSLLEAIPRVIAGTDGGAFLIAGEGPLRPRVEESAAQPGNNIRFVGWIPHAELPRYLNELKLLVLPSYTEGLPNIMLEAMACGTPVLATPVGSVPDVIRDGQTGFIIENNSPECIAQNIVRALAHAHLEQIAANARDLVEREFTFDKAVQRYRQILENV